jgi:hypothetical protein
MLKINDKNCGFVITLLQVTSFKYIYICVTYITQVRYTEVALLSRVKNIYDYDIWKTLTIYLQRRTFRNLFYLSS